jgi:hypothetical protein
VTLGYDAGIRRPDERVFELLLGGLHGGAGRRGTRYGGISRRQRLVVFAPGTRARLEQALGTTEFRFRLLLAGERFLERRFRLPQCGLLFDVREAHDRLARFDVIVDIEEHLGDTARRLRRHRGLVHGLYGTVIDALQRCPRRFGCGGFERQRISRRCVRIRKRQNGRRGESRCRPTCNTVMSHHVISSWKQGRSRVRAGSL